MKNDDHGTLVKSGGKGYNWLPDFVYGGTDGAITTFAIVAGVEGASLSIGIILVLGFANLVADGFSMGAGKYLSDKANIEQYDKIRKIELKHIKDKPEMEKEEVKEIMADYGFKGKDLARATEIFVSNPNAWVDLMMRNEFNLVRENYKPFWGGLATFVSFGLVGLIPLVAYITEMIFETGYVEVFWITSAATLIALFLIGAVKSRFTVKHWFHSGLEIMLVGGIAAVAAYFVGFILKGFL